MSASLEARCPSCQKQFLNDSLVLRHMNNPQTSCQNWLEFSASTVQEDSDHLVASHPTPNSRTNANAGINTNTTNENSGDCGTLAVMPYEVLHPNAPSFFGSGPTFMDAFNTGPYADKRRENLYYPFSSKGEWSLASWLLCSGLSMRAIDDFLALPIVSFQVFLTASSLIEDPDTTAFALLHYRKNTS